MRTATKTLACCSFALLLLAPGCADDTVKSLGYTKVTPTSIPGTTVEVLDPIQLTQKARIPENDPAYKSVEVFKDRLVFHYKRAPSIALAAGHVVAGGDKIGYLRKIVSVTPQGATKLEVKTQNAYLGEFIYKGHLRVTQEPLAKGWESVGGDINSKCYPLGPENSYSVFKSFGGDSGFDCKVSAGATLKLEPALTITPKLIFEVDFDPGWALIDGELVYAKFALDGTVVAGAKLTGKGVLSAKCEADIIKELRTRAQNDQLFKLWLPTLRFAVGPVPVVITHYLEPIAKSTLEAKLEVLEVVGTGQVKLGVKAGTEYKNKTWSPIWAPTRSGSLDLKLGDDQFKVTISDELAFGLGYTALIYSTAGPKLGLTLGTTLSASASPDTCKWSAKLELGVNFEYGAELQVPVLDKKIWDATGKVELFKKQLLLTGGDIPSCYADAGVEAGSDAGSDVGPDLGADLAVADSSADASADLVTDATSQDQLSDGLFDAFVCSDAASSEICDGLDNDCDGAVDEQLDCEAWAGDGSDGNLAVTSTLNINTAVPAGRTSPLASMWSVSAIGTSSVTLSGAPSGLASGDEVLLINLRGGSAGSDNAGRYETGFVQAVSGATVHLRRPIKQLYGVGGNANLTDQRVRLFRVPHLNTLSVSSGGALGSNNGGVVFLRAVTVNVAAGGKIDVIGRGFGGAGHASNGMVGSCGESYTGAKNAVPVIPGVKTGGLPNGGAGGGGESNCNVYNCTTQLIGAGGGGASFGTLGQAGGNNGSLHVGGQAGKLYGTAALDRLYLGSGGGGGAGGVSGPGTATPGGNGGGVIVIHAGAGTFSGKLLAKGQIGSVNNNCGKQGCGGGGAGSGGTVWISAPTLSLAAGAVSAEGGPVQCNGGGAGGDGRVRIDFKLINGATYGSAGATSALGAASSPGAGYTKQL